MRQTNRVGAEEALSEGSRNMDDESEVIQTEAVIQAEEVVEGVGTSDQIAVKTEMSNAQFEAVVEAQKQVRSFDILEAIEENFAGALNEMGVEKDDPSRSMIVHRHLDDSWYPDESVANMNRYKIMIHVKKSDLVKNVIESWKDSCNFDDLAFRVAQMDEKQIRIKEIRRVYIYICIVASP